MTMTSMTICDPAGLSNLSAQPVDPVLSRARERDLLARFLAARDSLCLVFSGEAGIGKTTLWQLGIDLARQQGVPVLSTRASPGEAGLLFAGLADLVDGMDDAVLDQVPAPQRNALDAALRRSAPDPVPLDPLAISWGFLAALRALASNATPLIAVDDVQWLDASSAQCLLFVARRVMGEQVRFLLSRRGGEPSNLEQTLEPVGVEQVRVEALSVGAIARLLSDRFGLALPRRVLQRVYQTSHGNPLFALELGRAICQTGLPPVGSDLPVPKLVDEAFGARVNALPGPLRQALLAVALGAGLSGDELATVIDPLAVEDAINAGLLMVDRTQVRPSHPMLAAAARTQSSAGDRRNIHSALADALADPVLRARHQALATVRSDPEVAATVAAAARLAIERGAVHEAEELSAHALRLTPGGAPEQTARVLDLARNQVSAGDLAGAAALLEGWIDRMPPGRPRITGHLLMGEASVAARGQEQFDMAIAEAGEDDEMRGVALCRKSTLLSSRMERLAEAERLAHEGYTLVKGTAEEGKGRVALGWAQALRGLPIDHLPADNVLVPFGANLSESAVDRPVAVQRAFRGHVDEGRKIVLRLLDLADQRGEPTSRLVLSIQLCEFSLRQGHIAEAEPVLGELEQWTAVPEMRSICARLRAIVAALGGRSAEAVRRAGIVMDERERPIRATWDLLEAKRALGLAAMFEGDFAAAVDHLDAVWQHCRQEGVDDPGAFPVAGDLVASLVEHRDLDRAKSVVNVLRRLSDEQNHPWGRATLRRSQALLYMAGGQPERAGAELQSAASEYGELGLEFEQARSLLDLGRLQRRTKKRGEARQALDDTADLFDRLGCDGWATKARAELTRVSGRRPVEENQLTPSEQRAVELAVAGLSNKEIAKALFVSVYTVEAHLSHAYAKLGVRSRAQLASRLRVGD
jgi:DNA-binding CsgD family transcriptional regulator